MRKLLATVLLILVLVCASFPGMAEGNVMKFDKNARMVFEGETLQTILIREGAPAGAEITYTSSNTRLATVDANGMVTGLSRGEVTITAMGKTEKQTFRTELRVTVARKAASLEINTQKLPLHTAEELIGMGLIAKLEDPADNDLPVLLIPVGKSFSLQVTTQPKDATYRNVSVSAEDDTVLKVKGTGITGQKAGETILTVANEMDPEVNVRWRVLVAQPVSRITVNASAQSVAVGSQISLKADIQPANATVPGVTWSSSDEHILTVDANGVVTGVKRGNARVVATAVDGSNVRANFSLRVTQTAEAITLDKTEVTVDAGRNTVLKATVLPKDTDDKNVVWSTSDPAVATVNNQGRITGVALGTCEIICTSKAAGTVEARATVHVQQPVTKVVFQPAADIWVGETGRVYWSVEPANASNPALTFTSSNNRVLTVAPDGTITGLKAGEAYVNAVSTDGSNRRAKVKVRVLQHVTGASMKRSVAYIDVRESATAGAIILPNDASNKNVVWQSADPSIATAEAVRNQGYRVKITGVSQGETLVTGYTEDGGYPVSILVRIGDWDHALRLREAHVDGDEMVMTVTNNSTLTITSITAEVSIFDIDGNPVPCNKKDDKSNTFTMVYTKTLQPGQSTKTQYWKVQDYKQPTSTKVSDYVVKVVKYQVDNDWVKTIRQKNQPQKKCPVHI